LTSKKSPVAVVLGVEASVAVVQLAVPVSAAVMAVAAAAVEALVQAESEPLICIPGTSARREESASSTSQREAAFPHRNIISFSRAIVSKPVQPQLMEHTEHGSFNVDDMQDAEHPLAFIGEADGRLPKLALVLCRLRGATGAELLRFEL
jgi:hypothetical protein